MHTTESTNTTLDKTHTTNWKPYTQRGNNCTEKSFISSQDKQLAHDYVHVVKTKALLH